MDDLLFVFAEEEGLFHVPKMGVAEIQKKQYFVFLFLFLKLVL